MNKPHRIFPGLFLLVFVFMSCAKQTVDYEIVQHTDFSGIRKIELYDGALWCATEGGLARWDKQEKTYSLFTTADGLPSNILTDIVKDHKGNLWVGTRNGLAAFNGQRWRHYGTSHGLPDAEITGLAVDSNGNLYIGTARGLATLNYPGFNPIRDKDAPGEIRITSVFVDRGDNLWAGTEYSGAFYRMDGKWHNANHMKGLSSGSIYTFAQNWDKSIWLGAWLGVFRWDTVGWLIVSGSEEFGHPNTRQLAANDLSLWFFTERGIHRLIGYDWEHYREADGLLSDNVYSGIILSEEEIFAGTDKGLTSIIDKEIKNYPVTNTPKGYNLISLDTDLSGNLWAGSWESGMSVLTPDGWITPEPERDDMLSTVRSMVFTTNGNYFHTLNGIISDQDGRWRRYSREDGVSGTDIRCGAFDNEGRYWVGTAAGISFLENGNWTRYRRMQGLPSEDIWTCIVDDTGTVWFGTTNGIVSASGTVLTDRTLEINLADTLDVRSSALVDGKVLFGTVCGRLIEYNDGLWNVYGKNYLGTSSGITAILPESPDLIWLGTDGGGIVRYTGKRSQTLTVSDGLPSNHVRALAFKDGSLWAACYGGLAEIKLK